MSSQHVIVITVGPVADFVQASRRTRDVWFSSHMVSEFARAAVHSLVKEGWLIVFPAFEPNAPDHPELEPTVSRRRENGQPARSTNDKIVAVGSGDPAPAVASAREAACERWRDVARNAAREARDLLRADADVEGIVEDFFEFVSAWAPYDPAVEDGPKSYVTVRNRVEAAVAARERLREFAQWPGTSLPKSSLDGFRETVLVKPQDRTRSAQDVARRYRLTSGEELDAIGLVKRMGGKPRQFPPLARIALASWIAAAARRCIDDADLAGSWAALIRRCEREEVSGVDRTAERWLDDDNAFLFDGEVFLEDQWPNLGLGNDPEKSREVSRNFGKDFVARVLKKTGAPDPHVACLVADGDNLTERLKLLKCPEEQRQFSLRLAKYAEGTYDIVAEHLGSVVYAGGDDLLAFVPVTRALACAAELREAFREAMDEGPGKEAPTLSVGIAIGHLLNPMRDLLAAGNRALFDDAKQGLGLPGQEARDALAVVVRKRGGEEIRFRANWDENPVAAIERLVTHIREGSVPSRLPFAVRELLRRLPKPNSLDESAKKSFVAVLAHELARIVAHKSQDKAPLTLADLELPDPKPFVAAGHYRDLYELVNAWVERYLVARLIAQAMKAEQHAKGEQP